MKRFTVLAITLAALIMLGMPLAFAYAGHRSRAPKGAWEYKALWLATNIGDRRKIEGDLKGINEELNKLGSEGWELVSADFGIYTLRRAK